MGLDVIHFLSKILLLQLVLYYGIFHTEICLVQHCVSYRTVTTTFSNVCDHVSFSFPITNDGNDPHD